MVFGCNLDCRYCYEREHNKRRRRLDLVAIETIFRKIAAYFKRVSQDEHLHFVVHGGEPMLLGAEYYHDFLRLQDEIIRPPLTYSNSFQTNLTLLNKGWLSFFQKEWKCYDIGVSCDFFGNDRRFPDGRSSTDLVLKNIQKLSATGLRMGLLTQVTKSNIHRLNEIYDFIRNSDISVRFGHLFSPKSRKFDPDDTFLVSDEQFSSAVGDIIKRWLSDDTNCVVANGMDIFDRLTRSERRVCCYSGKCARTHLSIQPDGSVNPCDDFYSSTVVFGNILEDSLKKIMNSKSRAKLFKRQVRDIAACRQCKFMQFCQGGCPGLASMAGRGHVGQDPLCRIHYAFFEIVNKYLEVIK